jgi:hypothetical protein
MKRTYLLLSWCALVAGAGQEAGSVNANPNQYPASKSTPHRSGLVPARYFVNPANNPLAIQAVREHMDRSVTLAGHYSQSVVGCGTECWRSWVVDRRTGAIIDVPYSDSEGELIADVRGRRESDLVEVIYVPGGEATGACRARNYRLRGTRFAALGGYFPARCP